jgi:hypothetical protein
MVCAMVRAQALAYNRSIRQRLLGYAYRRLLNAACAARAATHILSVAVKVLVR